MGKYFTEDESKKLRKEHRKIKDKRQADKIKTILSLDKGYTYEEVATILLLDDDTIRTYEKEYKENGMNTLLKTKYTGKKPMLLEE